MVFWLFVLNCLVYFGNQFFRELMTAGQDIDHTTTNIVFIIFPFLLIRLIIFLIFIFICVVCNYNIASFAIIYYCIGPI
jgi:hypothetical protein